LLPQDVKEQYLKSDGLKGPTNCSFLYSSSYLVKANNIRNEIWFPEKYKSLIILGDDGCGNLIGFDWSTQTAILWNPADGTWAQEQSNTVTEMWQIIECLYSES
jgi:hypothetical protein